MAAAEEDVMMQDIRLLEPGRLSELAIAFRE